MASLMESVRQPRDLDRLSRAELDSLAAEIREFLIENVSRTGGHLGPNLGVVELTIALHRVFDSPRDALIWDVGHQAYVHKLLTGRQDFSTLRNAGGLSGYPCRAESEHDIVENSHASTALSYADGVAKAFRLQGLTDRRVVGVIGDGALTGGMAWEALNNIAGGDLPVVVVVNDNERSYAPTIGGLANHLGTLRTTQGYERFLDWGKNTLARTPYVGGAIYETLHGMKKGIKDIVAPQGMFEDLGLKYIGPIDGHDVDAVESALRRAKAFGGPVIVHVLTRKGEGYEPARADDVMQLHQVNPQTNPETGLPFQVKGTSWTDVFAEEMLKIGNDRPDVVGITAAMLIPVGLHKFAQQYPDRIYDVGIAEQHAATCAAGLAFGGLHPVVAVYATFLNRAFDQVLMDCSLHKAGVTFVLDRAGITGPDGASHHGVWDLSILQVVPGIRVAVPRDAAQVRSLVREATDIDDGPTVVRFSKGSVGPEIEAVDRVDGVDVLRRAAKPVGEADLLIIAAGPLAGAALAAAEELSAEGIEATVVDPRWVKPVNPALVDFARRHRAVVTVEDNGRVGGVGAAISQALQDAGVLRPTKVLGVPPEFQAHDERPAILARLGLDGPGIAAAARVLHAQHEN
ncbi:MAG TPA: 1-deoxy-D-xylulose-5-phosphate synthase [Actinospica sp.]|nr:1-deoxy-D-xylulose-5-phosphate synthase [Actinospica sp.]